MPHYNDRRQDYDGSEDYPPDMHDKMMSMNDKTYDMDFHDRTYGEMGYGQSSGMDFTITERPRISRKKLEKMARKPPKECKEYKATFKITVGDKCGHPWEHRIVGTNDALLVNGIKGGIIHVRRGETYRFIIRQNLMDDYENPYRQYADPCTPCYDRRKKCDYPQQQIYGIYLTADPLGGQPGKNADPCDYIPTALPGTPEPTYGAKANCHFTVLIDKYFPEIFYYQTADFQCMGGIIIVHD